LTVIATTFRPAERTQRLSLLRSRGSVFGDSIEFSPARPENFPKSWLVLKKVWKQRTGFSVHVSFGVSVVIAHERLLFPIFSSSSATLAIYEGLLAGRKVHGEIQTKRNDEIDFKNYDGTTTITVSNEE